MRVWLVGLVLAGCGGGGTSPPDAMVGRPDAPASPDAGIPGPVDCSAVPAGPRPYTLLDRHHPVEDLAFDDAGHLLWSDGLHLYRSPKSGDHEVLVPNLSAREGIRVLPTGEIMVADREGGRLLRVSPDGVVEPVMQNLSFPDGIEIDRAGMVYLTDLALEQVYRVDPFSGEFTVIVDGDISYPDGITFDPTYEHLYIAGVAGVPTVYRLQIGADGTPGALAPWITGVGSGQYDGLATDACGNLYICDLADSKVYRVAPDKTVTTVLDRVSSQSYMTSLQWGTGVGEWDPLKIYVPDVGRGLLEVDLGVPSKPR